MASSLILKRFVYSSLLSCKSPTLLRPAASASHRSFNDHADDNDDRGSRSGVLDSSQVLNMMNLVADGSGTRKRRRMFCFSA
ncbi:heat shock 22 kDa protein, mitochondrial-like [Glycine soja]|uniref:heat shock 22 kDa protein, mitochondrial-like n=1 Tax=Glycine soja TaxID=3848 RepID=UPI0003DE8BD1|nr:heat shock 22 kDa protein, mitochondrial-like [Glycine soja]|eukprot:XP_006588316.1 heat shock 22 kDa protein, mitochondrial [Glycine max]